jgi:2-polyprenyl-3-methyl-5-hydroxy-6-metoxy-1,4-benzoquinol methylase
MTGYFLRQRQALSIALGASDRFWMISPLMYSAWQVLREELPRAVAGKVLDAGAGDLTARALLTPYAESYLSMEVERRHADVDIVDDIQTFATVTDKSFDTVYSAQVLEHVPQPWLAVQQIHRILKPGGKVVLSVPHLSHLHEEPHDRRTHCAICWSGRAS